MDSFDFRVFLIRSQEKGVVFELKGVVFELKGERGQEEG